MPNTARYEPASFPYGSDVGALVAVIRRLSLARSREEIMGVVTYGVRRLLQADGATFVLRDADRCWYAEEDAVSPLWKGRRFPMSACISGWCMTHQRSVAIPDIYQDPRIPVDAYRPTFVRSLAMAPVGRDEPVAALGAYWAQAREIRPDELEILQTIADSAALAVAHVELLNAASARRREPPSEPRPPAPPPAPDAAAAGPGKEGRRGFERLGFRRLGFGRLGERLRREGLRSNSPAAYGFAVLCVAVAAGMRLATEAAGVGPLVPFSTFYPATLLAILVAGPQAGLFAAGLGGAAAFFVFMPRIPGFSAASALPSLSLYFGASGLMVWMLERYRRRLRRLTDEDARLITLAREQHHRVQNAVAVVETIVRQSLRADPAQARVINQRIRAGLSDLDIRNPAASQPISLRALLRHELEPFDAGRFSFEGEDETPVAPELRGIITLAAHELATNALKYGALSTPDGRVSLDWRLADGRATLSWRERGGPPVARTQTRGYGSILLRRLVEASKGSLSLDFQPDGLVAEISLPLQPPGRR